MSSDGDDKNDSNLFYWFPMLSGTPNRDLCPAVEMMRLAVLSCCAEIFSRDPACDRVLLFHMLSGDPDDGDGELCLAMERRALPVLFCCAHLLSIDPDG